MVQPDKQPRRDRRRIAGRLWVVLAGALCVGGGFAAPAVGQDATTRRIEKDGKTYEETRRVVRREEWVPQVEERKQTVYRQQVDTEPQKVNRSYYVPVTEYRWQPVMQGRWNPFVDPYYTYQMVPYTRWELKTDTQTVTVPKPKVVPETQTVKVWVTKPRVVEQEVITRVEIPKTDAAEEIARRPGPVSLRPLSPAEQPPK